MASDDSDGPSRSSGLRPSRALRQQVLRAEGATALAARTPLPARNPWSRRALELGERLIEEQRGGPAILFDKERSEAWLRRFDDR